MRQRERRRSPIWHELRRRPGFIAAVGVLGALVAVVLLKDVLPLRDPNAQDFAHAGEGLSWAHPLGTDALGRDTLARLIYGAGVSLTAAANGVGIGIVLGLPLGLIAGYSVRTVDTILCLVVDMLQSIPPIILGLVVVSVMGPGVGNVMFAIGVILAPRFFRVARGATAAVRNETYIESARAVGCSTRRILWRYVLSNAGSAILVQISFSCGIAIIAEASLSFLGLGVIDPESSWGAMVRHGYQHISDSSKFLLVPPTLAIGLVIWLLSVIGDSVSDALEVSGE